MNSLNIDDLRSYVFCVYSGIEEPTGNLNSDSLEFLGTGFFVTKNGDALTAAHVLPSPEELEPNRNLYAILVFDGEVKFCRILMAAKFDYGDLVIFRVNTEQKSNPYFTISFEDIGNGSDVMAFGVSAHSPYGIEKELRTLKGHVTLFRPPGFGELSFQVPAGMSGGPVLIGSKCVGYLTGSVTSEEIIDRTEELIQLTNNTERVEITEIHQKISYGIFMPFSSSRELVYELLENRTLQQFIAHRNEL